jgi:hypothetical protein
MVVLAVVVLAVESYRESIQQGAQQVHLDKVTQAAQAREVVLAVKQVVVAVAPALLGLQLLNFTAVMAVMVLHHLSQELALPVLAVVVVEFFKLAM